MLRKTGRRKVAGTSVGPRALFTSTMFPQFLHLALVERVTLPEDYCHFVTVHTGSLSTIRQAHSQTPNEICFDQIWGSSLSVFVVIVHVKKHLFGLSHINALLGLASGEAWTCGHRAPHSCIHLLSVEGPSIGFHCLQRDMTDCIPRVMWATGLFSLDASLWSIIPIYYDSLWKLTSWHSTFWW